MGHVTSPARAARQASAIARFATSLYKQRAVLAYHGYWNHDPMALIFLRPGRADPYPIYEAIRARGPLAPTRLGNFMSTNHAVCNEVLRDRRMGHPAGGETIAGLSFLEMNPPDHTRLRKLAAPAFSPRKMAGYTELIEKSVNALVDDLPTHGTFDLVSTLAAPLPIAVISDLLGVPHKHMDEFQRYGATIGSALDGVKSMWHLRQLMTANAALERIFTELFELRRRDPSDDVISAIVAAEQIEPHELVPLCTLLLIAGFETTVNLISNGVLNLLDHPDQWRLLRSDPALAASAVEEVLRFDPPVQRTGRIALETHTVAGHEVRRGQFVATLIGGANRDPDVYADPSSFDITRAQLVEHMAFSSGIHYCLGAPLARLEATVAFRVIAERLTTLRRAGRVVRRNAATIRGPLHLPVAL